MQIKENIKAPRHCPLCGEFTAYRASNAENVSIWWRHHDYSYYINSTHTDQLGTPDIVSMDDQQVDMVRYLTHHTNIRDAHNIHQCMVQAKFVVGYCCYANVTNKRQNNLMFIIITCSLLSIYTLILHKCKAFVVCISPKVYFFAPVRYHIKDKCMRFSGTSNSINDNIIMHVW